MQFIGIAHYPRTMHCGGDIVKLLWFRPCMDLVNTIETTPLRVSLTNLADILIMMRGWTLLILEVKGQGHNGHIWK